MIYVYDIILNWSDNEVYEFFEWELNDDIEHIKRMPLFKINSKTFSDILNYDIKIDKDILTKIKDLTEVYTIDNDGIIPYASLFTDGVRVIAVEFDDNGLSIYKSHLLLEEESDVVMLSSKMQEVPILIDKLNKKEFEIFATRYEKEVRHILKIEIQDCYNKKNFDKLKYLYYECFGKRVDDVNIVYKKLLDSIDKEVNNDHNKLYEVVKLSYQNKN